MKKITCTIRFITPAFLGDANQNGAWRVPPFKAELRQWWRIVMARQNPALGWRELRDIEAELFGNAWPGKEPRKSSVRMRFNNWGQGQLQQAPRIDKIRNGKQSIGGGIYLGFGEIKGDKLEHPPAINAGEEAELRIGITTNDHYAEYIPQALALMGRYGTVGGRSRNGWGSFAIEATDAEEADTLACLIDWRQGLEDDWCRGIGRDEKDWLIWNTPLRKNWEAVMHDLAQLRSDLNHQFGSAQQRSLLSYPITTTNKSPKWVKELPRWGNSRVPNSLRFKVTKLGDQSQGLIFHRPCQPEDSLWKEHQFSKKSDGLLQFWQGVHQELDHRYKKRVSA